MTLQTVFLKNYILFKVYIFSVLTFPDFNLSGESLAFK